MRLTLLLLKLVIAFSAVIVINSELSIIDPSFNSNVVNVPIEEASPDMLPVVAKPKLSTFKFSLVAWVKESHSLLLIKVIY